MTRCLCLVALLAAAFGLACSRPLPAPAEAEEVAREAAPAGDPAWGTVKGRIVWGGGDLPAVKTLDVTKDADHCLEKGPIPSEEWVIDPKTKGVHWAFVWLAPEEGQGKLPIHPSLAEVKQKQVEMDQPCCKFEPHALGVRKGQVIVAKNSGKVVHNVDWKGIKQKGGNLAAPPGGKVVIDNLSVSDYPVTVACGIHPWMKAWVRVFDHPYFTVTKPDGSFEIKDAPAGKCRLVVWHEGAGWRNQETRKAGDPIEIKPGGVTDLGELELKPSK